MPTILTNCAFPNRRADLSNAEATGDVIGYESKGDWNHNQIVCERYYHKKFILLTLFNK